VKTARVWTAAAALALASIQAYAGGPLGICNSAPLKYSGAGSVNLHYDGGGTLGSRSKAQADAIVAAATAKWTDVPTSTITLGRGADLPVDVTIANYTSYWGKFSDGLNPVLYDTDGAITDSLLGVGQKNSILGFAGSAWSGGTTCRYIEGQAVINGARSVSDSTMTIVIAHELGHLIGLDHSQLDATQGLASSNYPLMYPIATRTVSTLHDDDAAAVSSLYPDPSVSGSYGTLTGNFRLADGATAVRGANIWARQVQNPSRVLSSVSDYLKQGTGYFSMLLPPGTYTLHAEAIASDFNGGSSVGPYADSYPSDLSFQPPLYVSGAPMAPVTLGNASPVQFTITAGCTANANFRIDGIGSVGGNCGTASAPSNPTRLSNLSTRAQVLTGNDVAIGGLVIGGGASKTVVVSVAGPSLATSGITNPLLNPTLTLVRSADNAVLATNDNWQSAPNVAAIQASGFAPNSPLEPAILATLPPGAYTAIVQGAAGATGVGLIGIFEVDHPEVPLVNISTRAKVLTGNDVMIAGFIVQGATAQNVVVNVAGPSLASAGITNPLANPTLTLVRSSDNAVIATNDNWGSAANAAQIQASGFAPNNSLEPAIMMSLPPGAYTAIVQGAGGGTGVALVGVFTTG
jgi:hypothetical protein